MEEKELYCISCKANIINNAGKVVFKCPQCGEFEIIRCKECRQKAVKYVCPSCNFEGPN